MLGLLAEGLQHEEIGRRLGISSETVRTLLRKASDRLGAATRTQAVATALRLGLICVTDRSLGEHVERQLEVASLSGEVHAVMQAIVERLLELPVADGASLSTVADELAHFAVSLGDDAPLRTGHADRRDPRSRVRRTGELHVLRGTDGADMELSLTRAPVRSCSPQ